MKRVVAVLTVAAILAGTVVVTAIPAVAQAGKAKGKGKAAEAPKAAAAPKAPTAMPNTGGFISPSNAALMGLGGGALLVGGGLVARRVVGR